MLSSNIRRALFLSVILLVRKVESFEYFSLDLVRLKWRSLFASSTTSTTPTATTETTGQGGIRQSFFFTADNSTSNATTNATTESPSIHNESTVPPHPAPSSNGTNATTQAPTPTLAPGPHNGTDTNVTTLPPSPPPSNYSNATTLPPNPSSHNETTLPPTPSAHNGTEPPVPPPHNGTEPPVPPPHNGTEPPVPHHNETLPPTPSNHTDSNYTTLAPSPAPSKTPRMSFWKIVSKTIAWLIFIALSVLAFGGIMSHRYRIYFFLRGVWFTLLRLDCTQWIVNKLSFLTRDRRGGVSGMGGGGGGAFDSGLNTIIFDSDMSEGLLLNENNNNRDRDD